METSLDNAQIVDGPQVDRSQIEGRGGRTVPVAAARPMRKILLLDGYSTRTLACVRSFGKNGVPFVVGGETRWDMSLFSRYANETCVYTSPKIDVARFVADVNSRCRALGADHMFPTSEAAIMACSEREAELEATPIIPRREDIATMFSKKRTLALAQSLGILTPRTVYVAPGEAADFDGLGLKFPVVVKAESSETLRGGKAASAGKTFYANNVGELKKECATRLGLGQTLLLQEFIDGYGVGVSGLFSGGAPVALIGHRRIRESNPLGGPSALAESVAIEPEWLEAATALIGATGFTGPAMVEFKVERGSGRPYLMEINGRFWGSVLLALAAGLELPYLYWKMLNGMEIGEDEKRYRIGVRGRSVVGDTKCLLVCLKGRPAGWPGEMATPGGAVRDYLKSFFDPQTKELICTAGDPLPFFGRLVQPHS